MLTDLSVITMSNIHCIVNVFAPPFGEGFKENLHIACTILSTQDYIYGTSGRSRLCGGSRV